MLIALQLLSTLSAGLFAGAALYITAVEHPVRAGLSTAAAATQWAPSYQRATWMQAPLALASLFSGTAAFLMGAGLGWLVAALLIGAVVPVTFMIIMPTNRQLLEADRDLGSAQTRLLLARRGQLHALRTVLSLMAFILFACLTQRELARISPIVLRDSAESAGWPP